ncbi:MAG: PilW family protein [Proteobacteria bacterium]|nr:PilW family protein [Pseudomonadota bacterium]
MLFLRSYSPRQLHPPRYSSGFSLVEIMIGMVIGMLGIIVMMQIFALAEGQKRATTGGGDAQNNGAIALYGVQRDIRQAGWGNSDLKVIGCDVLLPTTRGVGGPPAVTLNPMAPVTINHPAIPPGDANTDTLLMVYGNTNGTPQGDGFVAANTTANIFQVQTPTSFTVNDWVIAIARNRPAQPASCATILDRVACIGIACAAAIPSAANVVVATGAAVNSLLGGAPSSTLYNLGQAPKILVYAIRGGNLTLCDYMAKDCGAAGNTGNATIWVPIGSNIVSLRAQYGRDTTNLAAPAMDGVVDIYDQTSPDLQTANNVAPSPTTGCGWARISAIRLVLVARSGQYEKSLVTTAAPAWLGTATTPIVLAGLANWQNYRYKIFQTVVPLRNIAWLGAQAGC